MEQPSKRSNAPVTSPENSPPPRNFSGAHKRIKTGKPPTPASVPSGKRVANGAHYDAVMLDLTSVPKPSGKEKSDTNASNTTTSKPPGKGKSDAKGNPETSRAAVSKPSGKGKNDTKGKSDASLTAASKSSGKGKNDTKGIPDASRAAASKSSGKEKDDSMDVDPRMANSKIESLRRASVAKEAAMAKSRALDIALQIATKDAEEAKQQTMKMHDAWMSRLEKVIPELPDDPGVRAGFFNMVFEETHATMMEREAKLQAQIRAVHEKEAHVIQLEKELVLLKKEMDRMKSMDADSRVKELMAKFRQS